MRTLVLYDDDADGFAAAYAAKLRYPEAELVPMDRGDNPPSMENVGILFVLDFNFSRDVMLELAQKVPNIVLLDHHVSAQKELYDLQFCHFDTSKSSAVISWEWFFPEISVPAFYGYVQDADLYKWSLPRSREVHLAVDSYPRDVETWEKISGISTQRNYLREAMCISALVDQGENIARFADEYIKGVLSEARLAVFTIQSSGVNVTPIITFDPDASLSGENTFQVPVVNSTCFSSDVGHQLLSKYPESKFAAVYRDLGSGLRQWFLCCNENFDVSSVCKCFGGGGHSQAGGFRTFHDADYGIGTVPERRSAL